MDLHLVRDDTTHLRLLPAGDATLSGERPRSHLCLSHAPPHEGCRLIV
jgi:hypothetical protein